jgi:hypothetical protein
MEKANRENFFLTVLAAFDVRHFPPLASFIFVSFLTSVVDPYDFCLDPFLSNFFTSFLHQESLASIWPSKQLICELKELMSAL